MFCISFFQLTRNALAHVLGALACMAAMAAPSATESNVAYGEHPQQVLDVYRPLQDATTSAPAPAIFMVHGGAWSIGDKANPGVAGFKAAHWLKRGYAFVSVNYRLPSLSDVAAQAHDVAQALAFVQHNAPRWNLDPTRVVLMGHSAGAHLVSLLNADPQAALRQQAQPWLGAVSLDSAALDLPAIMQSSHHPRLYDRVFTDRAQWQTLSPRHRLQPDSKPSLLVCSTQRADSCPQAQAFANHAQTLGVRAQVLSVDQSHAEINKDLGKPSNYTSQVDAFLHSLGLP